MIPEYVKALFEKLRLHSLYFSSSGDEDEYNHELEDSTESFENELNKIREDIGRRSEKYLFSYLLESRSGFMDSVFS